jgi:hypothetical protein
VSSLSSSSAIGSDEDGDTDSDEGNQTEIFRGPACRTWEEEGSRLTPEHIRTSHNAYDHGNNNILDGLWLGQEDGNMLSRFVEQHFYNYRLVYSLFEEWAVACFKINPGSTIYVEEWMALKDNGRLAALTAEHQAKEQEAQVDKRCNKIQSLKHSTHRAHTGLEEQTLSARAA